MLQVPSFELYLFTAVAVSGLFYFIDRFLFKATSEQSKNILKKTIQFGRSIFPILLLVFAFRSFVLQPFRVVSGSLEPTVAINDFLLVNQFSYGVRFPVFHFKLLNISKPKIGDIALFYFPPDPTQVFVKRVIGTPGDHIVYRHKLLMINGKRLPQYINGIGFNEEPGAIPELMDRKSEIINGIKHEILEDPNMASVDFDVKVPPGHYFMMGDNRDRSLDSRNWGFVPEKNLIGKAMTVIMSWDNDKHTVRWHRLGKTFV